MENFITEKPKFSELLLLHNDIEDCRQSLMGLADEDDTAQRASDLYLAIVDLMSRAKEVLTTE